MTQTDMPRTLGARHLAERIGFERTARRLAAADAPADLRTIASTPAGRRQLRGIPCVGTGGLDERRNPLLEVLDRERDAAFAEAARSATDEARIERAARAIHERHFPRTPWEDSRDDARDYCRDEARVALAAADQEDAT